MILPNIESKWENSLRSIPHDRIINIQIAAYDIQWNNEWLQVYLNFNYHPSFQFNQLNRGLYGFALYAQIQGNLIDSTTFITINDTLNTPIVNFTSLSTNASQINTYYSYSGIFYYNSNLPWGSISLPYDYGHWGRAINIFFTFWKITD